LVFSVYLLVECAKLTLHIAQYFSSLDAAAFRIGISERALYNKLSGNVSFTWDEAITIKDSFFPDIDPQRLFARAEEKGGKT